MRALCCAGPAGPWHSPVKSTVPGVSTHWDCNSFTLPLGSGWGGAQAGLQPAASKVRWPAESSRFWKASAVFVRPGCRPGLVGVQGTRRWDILRIPALPMLTALSPHPQDPNGLREACVGSDAWVGCLCLLSLLYWGPWDSCTVLGTGHRCMHLPCTCNTTSSGPGRTQRLW